jgi:uncharacterized protein YebE (UPF0316 family)
MTAFIIFIVQFCYVMALGFQQLNVIHNRYVGAFVISLLLGVGGYHITATIALHANQPMFSTVWWAYILAGPLGIITAMRIHPWIRNKFSKDTDA